MAREVNPAALRERRRMERGAPDEPPYELLAMANGEELYRTEYRDTEEAILEAAAEANRMLDDGEEFEHDGETVDEFVPVETGTTNHVN